MNFFPCYISEEQGTTFIDTGDFKIPVPERIIRKTLLIKERELTFGVRPEDLSEVPPTRTIEMPTIEAEISVIEPLGREILVNLSTGKTLLQLCCPQT
jgi:ABC-type sugar transport system ATPase subunit